MTLLIRQRGPFIDVTEEVVSRYPVFVLPIRICCQRATVALSPCEEIATLPAVGTTLTIRHGDKPVRWECPHCLTTITMSVLS